MVFLELFLKEHRSIITSSLNHLILYFYSLMKKTIFIVPFYLICHFFSLSALSKDDLLSHQAQEAKIIVNNRILAKINGKVITTHDIMKKMDMGFYRHFPEYTSSTIARYHYYQANWQYILDELIIKELILADAKESKIEVSNGDVRQEMEYLFGPTIIANLDKVGMSFDEAFKIVQGDLLLRHTVGGRVNAKVLRIVTPAKIRQAYEEFIRDPDHARVTNWVYQVITIRDRTPSKAAETADKAYRLLIEESVPVDRLIETMKEKKLLGRKAKVTVSEDIQNNEKELSAAYQKILSSMDKGMYSQPSEHKSRSDNALIYRIFYVKDKIPGGMPTFQEMESTLKEKLFNDISEKETDEYIKKLKQHFHVKDSDLEAMVPSNYQPFILKNV